MQIQTPAVIKAIESRSSVNFFQAGEVLEDEAILRLVELAVRAPSAFNLQNWRFIAVRSPEQKSRLRAASMNQAKIEEAAVTFIMCGQYPRKGSLPALLAPSVEAGFMPAAMAEDLSRNADDFYASSEQLARDEAVRSASLAGAFLLLAAEAHGLGACPMVGFDAEALSDAFELDADEVPVMLITVGTALDGNWPQKSRRAATAVAKLV
ncbi:MAG: nitroreductase family protein [Pannonibacter sp.]